MCEDLKSRCGTEVGSATLVLSHCWGNLFGDSVEAVLEAVEDGGVDMQASAGGVICMAVMLLVIA